MKQWAGLTLGGAILVGGAILAPRAAGGASELRAANLPAPRAEQPEPHPQINAAIRALETAKTHLQKAAHDFGGHRVDAIAAIDKAEAQLRLALQYDK